MFSEQPLSKAIYFSPDHKPLNFPKHLLKTTELDVMGKYRMKHPKYRLKHSEIGRNEKIWQQTSKIPLETP